MLCQLIVASVCDKRCLSRVPNAAGRPANCSTPHFVAATQQLPCRWGNCKATTQLSATVAASAAAAAAGHDRVLSIAANRRQLSSISLPQVLSRFHRKRLPLGWLGHPLRS